MSEVKRCDRCRFSAQHKTALACHRYPPAGYAINWLGTTTGWRTYFTGVDPHDWCGEFQEKPDAQT